MTTGTVRVAVGIVAVIAAVAVVAATAGAVPGAAAGSSFVTASAPVTGYDAVETRIDLHRDGDATWFVTFRYELTDPATRRAFERARANVSNPPGVFVGRMRRAVATAEQATGRSMAVQNGSVETVPSVSDGREGLVTYRFTWSNFAKPADDGQYVLGDAIGGLRLGPTETLVIEWPDGLERAAVSPAPDASQTHVVSWSGPMRFRTEDPTVRLERTGGSGVGPLVLAVAALGLGTVAALGWYGRSRWLSDTDTDDETPAAGADGEAATAASSDGPPADLLTDEERVLRLLEESGGRMKQQDLLSAVEWSRTKASDVVNEMHEANQIEVYRLGRENVLALPGEIEV